MNTTQIAVKMVLDRWNASIKNFDTALNDLMLPLLDMGDKIHPEFTKTFIDEPDKAVAEIPSAQELRNIWSEQYKMLSKKFEALQPEAWFEKHTSVSAEDFAKEPHRNKLNIMITRTTHLAYHTGQIILI
ncbi:MAG: DinB family protein [Flavobacterium sp.]|nr:MAG: DinB family protein [Flavobacterium sp.]